MTDPVPFAVPSITEAELRAVAAVLEGGWLTTGERARCFEERFAERVGATYAVAVNSCTAALHLALVASDIATGDEVLVPSMTFAASAEVVEHVGATPVLVDVRADTLEIDLEDAAERITERTAALIPVHYAGQPCDMDAVGAFAAEHGLITIEDAAHAFPAAWDGVPVGSFGDATCFSFYANKTITTGEGGMLVTDDVELARRARRLSLHGLSDDAWDRYSTDGSAGYDITEAGFKYNMPDTAAALGLAQLDRADDLRQQRQQLAEQYLDGLCSVPGVVPLRRHPAASHAWHLFVVHVEPSAQRPDRRDDVIRGLRDRGIASSIHYRALHLHSYYRDAYGYAAHDLPRARQASSTVLSLPLFPDMTEDQLVRVTEALKAAA